MYCVACSGESGAGKTESAKYMIKHIINLCHSGADGAALENKIIQVWGLGSRASIHRAVQLVAHVDVLVVRVWGVL